MPVKKIAVALVALMSLTTAVEAQTPKDLIEALKVKWNTPTEPFRMIGNVYYVGTDGLASYLITSPQGHILVDTVMPGGNLADQGEHRETGLQDHRHQIPPQHPRAYRSHRRPGRIKAGQRRPTCRG